VLPGLAEQLDAETQCEQARFRGLLGLSLLGLLFWWPVCVRAWTSRHIQNTEHVLKETFSPSDVERHLPNTLAGSTVYVSRNETDPFW
jgi:hypothetical protein